MSKQERPVCVQHACEMLPKKNGFLVQVNASWGPYEIHSGDMYECPQGYEQVVVGFGNSAIARHSDQPQAAFKVFCAEAGVAITPDDH